MQDDNSQEMDTLWGEDVIALRAENAERGQLFRSHNYQRFPIGWVNFSGPGTYKISVSCLEGDMSKASLKSLHFTPVHYFR